MLWAGLFSILNIDFFEQLFTSEWFIYPVLATVNGCGIIILRNQSQIIDTITRIQQALMKVLLLVIIFILMIFLLTLPITGLEPLWQTNSGSALILTLLALALFCVNAVYQDHSQPLPYHLFLHRFVYVGIALLPIYSVISCYGLSLRINQYGWTVERGLAMLLWAILSTFALGYVIAIIKRRDQWIAVLSKVNIGGGALILLLMLLINSPLLELRQISATSQLARVQNNTLDYADIDLHYFKNNLAAPGYQALQQLKSQLVDSHPELVKKIDQLYRKQEPLTPASLLNKEQLINTLQIWPTAQPLPADLPEAIYKYAKNNQWQFRQEQPNYLLAIDMNKDNVTDYVLVSATDNSGQIFYLVQGQWQHQQIVTSSEVDVTAMKAALLQNNVKLTAPKWQEITIGDNVYHVNDFY